METLTETPILKFHSDTLHSLRELYGLETAERVDEAVNILVEWLKKQDHFIKKDFRRDYLERAIILSKGSVERAKQKIDKICTLRTLLPNFFEGIDIRNTPASKVSISCLLPKLTEDHCRIFFVKNSIKNYNGSYLDIYKHIIMISEYLQAYEYCKSLICVLDYLDSDIINVLKNLDLVELRQGVTIITEGFGARMKGIHFLATSNAFDILLTLFKQILGTKLIDRVHLHKNFDTLSEHIPKDLLPKNYGGSGDMLENVFDNMVNELTSEEFKEYYKEMCCARTDETLRSQELFNEQYLGMPGSFRKLIVD